MTENNGLILLDERRLIFTEESGIFYCEHPDYPVENVRGRGTNQESALRHWRALTKRTEPKQPDKTREIVLPSGRFARIRPVVLADMLPLLMTAKGDLLAQSGGIVAVIANCTTVDGKTLTSKEWLTMEYEDALPIIMLFVGMMEACKPKGVA